MLLAAGLWTACAPVMKATPGRPSQAAVPHPSVPPGPAPRVSLRADAAMTAPLQVAFTAQLPPGGTAQWVFADGGQGSGAAVTHTFYRPGRYTVQLQMQAGGHTYTASVPLEVRSAGPERAAVVLLQGSGSLALSAQGSVVYAPYAPRFTLDGQPLSGARQALRPGTHTASVSVAGTSGTLQHTATFRSAPALGRAEAVAQRAAEAEVLRLTNQARAAGWACARQAVGGRARPPLRPDAQLQAAARAQSVGMALNGYFAHRSAVDGSLPDDRVRASGYTATSDAENIAAGQTTPREVVDAWLHSPGHCANIMGDFVDLGVAYIQQDASPQKHYWTQVFGKK